MATVPQTAPLSPAATEAVSDTPANTASQASPADGLAFWLGLFFFLLLWLMLLFEFFLPRQ